MSPEPPYDINEGASIGRVSIKKQFSGDLEASSSVTQAPKQGLWDKLWHLLFVW